MSLEKQLLEIASINIKNDFSHDILHAKRVLKLSKQIAEKENGDLDIIIPCAIFHDVICYPKDDIQKNKLSSIHSAEFAKKSLEIIVDYPKDKIHEVVRIIENCSFSKGIVATSLEEKIIQDADKLEATGAISVMRTFASTGIMNIPFYNEKDPFCVNRVAEDKKYGLDLFFTRLLKVKKLLYTKTAKKIAEERTVFLKLFLKQLNTEL